MGHCYGTKKFSGGGYKSFTELVKDKSKKLLIPFITVLLLYAVPVKALSGFYSKSDNFIKDIFIDEVLIQKNFYLWYLPTLFFIFLINYVLEKKMHIKMQYKLAVMLASSCIYSFISINALSLIARFIIWFYMGYCFENLRERINDFVSLHRTKYIILSGAFFILISLAYFIIPNPAGVDIYSAIKLVLKPVCAILGCMFAYNVCLSLSLTSLVDLKIFKTLRSNTFGMYLYSDPWNYVVLAALVHLLGSAVFVTNWGSAIMYFSRIIVTGGVSLVISMALKKTKVRYIC